MARPIYVDLDNTLIAPVYAGNEIADIRVRPGTPEFLERLAQHGDLVLLTHAVREHADEALARIGPAADLFVTVLSREDLQPVIDQMDAVVEMPGIQHEEVERLLARIPPIAPSGVVFDDMPVGSRGYRMKALATGIGPDMWIEVPYYGSSGADSRGLDAAYKDFVSRVVPRLSGHRSGLSGRRAHLASKEWLPPAQIKPPPDKADPDAYARAFEDAVRRAFVHVYGKPRNPDHLRSVRSSWFPEGRRMGWTKPRPEAVLVFTEYGWVQDPWTPDTVVEHDRWMRVQKILDEAGWAPVGWESINPAVHEVFVDVGG